MVIGDSLGGGFPGFRVGGGFRAVACLYFFPQGKGVLLFKQCLYFCLCFLPCIVIELCCQIGRKRKGVMPDLVKVVLVFVIVRVSVSMSAISSRKPLSSSL